MGSLAEAWRQHQFDQHEKRLWDQVRDAIRAGMWPFDTGTVTMSWYEPGFENLDRTLLIEIETVPNYDFKYKVDERAMFRAYDPEAFFVDSICEPIFRHFRYRPSLPVDDHIVLGED